MGNSPSCGTPEYSDYLAAQYLNHPDWFSPLLKDMDDWQYVGCKGGVDPGQPGVCQVQADLKGQSCNCGGGQAYMVDVSKIEDGIQCHGGEGAHNQQLLTTQEWNWFLYSYHLGTKGRIADLCGDTHVDTVWPEFYHLYNNKRGRDEVDTYIKNNPDLPMPCQQALKSNYTEDVQRKYGLLNGFDWADAGFNSDQHGARITYGMGQSRFMTLDEMKARMTRQTIAETEWAHPKAQFGNPLWDEAQRREKFRLVIGKDYSGTGKGQDFIDEWGKAYVDAGVVEPGKSADDYFDPLAHAGTRNWTSDPAYGGQLPYAPPFNLLPHEPFHRNTENEDYHKWTQACNTPEMTQKVLPLVAAGVCGGLAGMIVPGEYARVMAAVTVGSAAYLEVKSIYGLEALAAWANGQGAEPKHEAAMILSVGAPLSVMQALYELELVPAQLSSSNAYLLAMGAAAGGGYLTLYPVVDPILSYGGDALTVLAAPLDILASVAHYFASGCANHDITWTRYTCKCENSNNKPALSAAIVKDIYGATGKQAEMRMDCMHAATTTGSWGTDPYAMGSCDSHGFLDNPMGCLSAGEWAYQKWDPSLNDKASVMWGEISHCVAQDNPSMLPPLSVDSDCVKKYGPNARAGGITPVVGGAKRGGDAGTCYDYRAPAGQQEAGKFNWGEVQIGTAKAVDSCTIL